MSRGAGVDVKICGLCRPEDARAASRAGATYLGVVFGPSPRRRTSAEARAIWGGVDGRRVGVFVDADVDVVRRLASDLELDVAQFHGSEAPGECARVRDAGIEVWKAVRMSNVRMENQEAGDGSALGAELERYADAVDGILLEGYSLRGHGGVGARLDWSLLEPVRAGWPAGVRLVLAGGLTPRNVARAIEFVRPDVVDVSSGVERRVGAKDEAAVRAFVAAARTAGAGR